MSSSSLVGDALLLDEDAEAEGVSPGNISMAGY